MNTSGQSAMSPLLGKVCEWNDERGFGFVQPLDGGARHFFHIRDYVHDGRRPEPGELVRFVPKRDAQSRPQAGQVRRAVAPARGRRAPEKPRASSQPVARLLAAMLPLAFLALVVIGWQLGRLNDIALFALAGLQLATWLFYMLDKHAAQQGAWRIAENTLHLLELAGGWPSALIAQQVLRHKNRKSGYQMVFWPCAALNIGALGWWIFHLR